MRIPLIPFVDARLEDLQLLEILSHIFLGLDQCLAIVGLFCFGVICEVYQHQLRMSKKKQVGLFVVTFAFIDTGLLNEIVRH